MLRTLGILFLGLIFLGLALIGGLLGSVALNTDWRAVLTLPHSDRQAPEESPPPATAPRPLPPITTARQPVLLVPPTGPNTTPGYRQVAFTQMPTQLATAALGGGASATSRFLDVVKITRDGNDATKFPTANDTYYGNVRHFKMHLQIDVPANSQLVIRRQGSTSLYTPISSQD